MINMLKPNLFASVVLLALIAPGLFAQTAIDDAAEAIETLQMQRLAKEKSRPGVTIDAFKSDGCSGGMSQTWSYLAETLPEFARYIGEQPPWEHCCVAHDRDYWLGETDFGYTQRQQADARLRECVQASGRENSDEIAQALGLPKQNVIDVIDMIDLTAELMYLAVRIGGGPCTGLPWRWGHGWPPCSEGPEPGAPPAGDPPQNTAI